MPRREGLLARRHYRLDWRWHLACEASELTRIAAHAQLEDEEADPWTLAAYRFKVDADINLDTKWTRGEVAAAYTIFTGEPALLLQIEALALGGDNDAQIASRIDLPISVVETYCNVFFDVRDRARGWQVARLFPTGLTGRNEGPMDRRTAALRRAFMFGADEFWIEHTGQPWTEQMRDRRFAYAKDMMRSLLAEAAADGDVDTLRGLGAALGGSGSPAPVEATAHSTSIERETGEAVMAFLGSMKMQVMTPSEDRKRSLPAREPRAHEYFEKFADRG